MNYRHGFHAGNFADVVKHALLVRLVRALQRKPRGFLYLDTHAGRGGYDLTAEAAGDTLSRTPEWPDGVGRLWSGAAGAPAVVAEYVEQVRRFDRARGNLAAAPRFYPGSPALVAALLRPADRMLLCERHPAECAALRAEMDGRPQVGVRVTVQEIDGYVGIRAALPPPERRALVLVDPPYEAQDEYARAAAALGEGLRRFPSGTFALWYPLTERARVGEFLDAITALQPPPTLAAEVAIAGDGAPRKLKGCGLVVVNPPWLFAGEAASAVEFLATALAQEPGGSGRLAWLVPET